MNTLNNTHVRSRYFLWAAITAFAAILVHIYLSVHTYEILTGNVENSLCNINATFNCDAVAASQYAKIFGVPIAMFGIFANLILLILCLVSNSRVSENPETQRRYAYVLSFLIMLTSVVMGVISSVMIKKYCIFCMTVYFLSIMAFFFIYKGSQKGVLKNFKSDLAALSDSQKWVWWMAVIVFGVVLVAHSAIQDAYHFNRVNPAEYVYLWKQNPNYDFDLTKGLVSQNSSTTPIKMTIVEFADFMCPHCRLAYPTIHAFVESRPDVKLVFKSFPLDGKCNPDIPTEGNGVRCDMAFATFCAEKIAQKGWAFHNFFFDNQEKFYQSFTIEKDLKDVADQTKVNYEELVKCVKSDEVKESIKAQTKEGQAAKLQGTPTIFVNGKQLPAGQFIQVLEAAYKEL